MTAAGREKNAKKPLGSGDGGGGGERGWGGAKKEEEKILSASFSMPAERNICATIRISRDILCFQYAGLFLILFFVLFVFSHEYRHKISN